MIQKALLYCTKGKLSLRKSIKDKDYYLDNGSEFNIIPKEDYVLNGKIVAECEFEVEDLRIVDDDPLGAYWYETKTLSENEVLEKSCLTSDELFEYLGDYNEGYAIHIKNLHIFDKPRFIQDYSKNENPYNYIENAPQNMMYAYDVKSFNNFEKKVLISIRPEWLCKILNNEKTIEIRKKVLREMLG